MLWLSLNARLNQFWSIFLCQIRRQVLSVDEENGSWQCLRIKTVFEVEINFGCRKHALGIQKGMFGFTFTSLVTTTGV